MRILTITTFFPNGAEPQRAVFVKNLVHALKGCCPVDVIAPIPYAPPGGRNRTWRTQRAIAARETIHGIAVLHPRFVVLPKLGWFSGLGYFLGILSALRDWKRQLADGERPVIHAHCAYPDAVGVILAARVLMLPCVVTVHGSDINVYASHATLRFQIRWAMRNAAGVIAVSAGLQQKVLDLIDGNTANIGRIPCAGFDATLFYPQEKRTLRPLLGMHEQARVVVFVGALVPVKGVEFLLAAWATLARCNKLEKEDKLILLGDGPLRGALLQQVRQGGIESSVVFAGMTSQAQVACWVAAADLLCLPSLNEGTPNAIVEALACGIPVVASHVGGIPELIREGQNGRLVPAADPGALALALEQALADKWEPVRIANSVAHLTWRAIADQNFEFLRLAIEAQR